MQPVAGNQYGAGVRASVASEKKNLNPLQQWWQREETVTKVLAVVGGLITLIGLVFLATLAYSTGILGPSSSVILAAIVTILIFATAFRAHRNQPSGVTAPAMIVVAVLGGLADLWVAVFKLEWLSEITGSVLTTLICIAGLAVAYRWNQEKLAVIVTLLSPAFITPVFLNVVHDTHFSPAIPGCIAATALAAFGARWGRPWINLHAAACAIFVLGIALTWESPHWTFIFPAVGVAVLIVFSYDQPVIPRPLTVAAWLAVLLAPIVVTVDYTIFYLIFEVIIFGLVLVWAFAQHGSALFPAKPAPLPDNASAAVYVSAVSVVATLIIEYNITLNVWFLVGIIGLCALVIALFPKVHPAATDLAAAGALLTALNATARLLTFNDFEGDQGINVFDHWILPAAASLALALYFFQRKRTFTEMQIPVVLGAATLLTASSIIPGTLLLIDKSEMSFMLGHMIISVSWIVLGILLLSRDGDLWKRLGLALALAAVAKLVFFDLSILGGVVQVLAFILSGAILLLAAFQREKLFGKKSAPTTPQNPSSRN